LKFSPYNPYLLNNIGYILIKKNKNFQKGIAFIRKADKLSPDDGYIKESLGWALYRYGKYEDALINLEQAHMLLGNQPRLISHLEAAYTALNMTEKALEMKTLLAQINKTSEENNAEEK